MEEVVRELGRNPVTVSWTPVEDFIENISLLIYILKTKWLEMVQADIRNLQCGYTGNLRSWTWRYTVCILPCTRQDFSRPILLLGHLAEGCREHYLSLSSPEVQRLRREAFKTVENAECALGYTSAADSGIQLTNHHPIRDNRFFNQFKIKGLARSIPIR